MSVCRDCEQQLWHCHGTLIRHPDGSLECSDDGCPGVDALHAFRIACAEVAPSCCGHPGVGTDAAWPRGA